MVAGTQCWCACRQGRVSRCFGLGGCQEATGCVWVIDAGRRVNDEDVMSNGREGPLPALWGAGRDIGMQVEIIGMDETAIAGMRRWDADDR